MIIKIIFPLACKGEGARGRGYGYLNLDDLIGY
jgi:hypothetical protein